MENAYKTPLARIARFLEIFIPAYMFGKAWGIASPETLALFRAEFPAFIIDGAEAIKAALHTHNPHLQRFVATSAGALVGFAMIAALAVLVHYVLRDRRYIDSLRFTAVTMIPIAVLNGTLSHGLGSLITNVHKQSPEELTRSVLHMPWVYLVLNVFFFFVALWFMGKRTGVSTQKRVVLIGLGTGFIALYLALGLMVTPGEWRDLLPILEHAKGA